MSKFDHWHFPIAPNPSDDGRRPINPDELNRTLADPVASKIIEQQLINGNALFAVYAAKTKAQNGAK